MFLTPDELATLTGRKLKRLQIQVLKANGIPFFINASGAPIVARSAVEGGARKVQDQSPENWIPRPLRHAA